MKNKIAGLILLIAFTSAGHDVIVHEAITVNAAASAAETSVGYGNFLQIVAPDCSKSLAVAQMKNGSEREDDQDAEGDIGGKRSLNHFYDPYHKTGLTDSPVLPEAITLGLKSFDWASQFNAQAPITIANPLAINIC